MEMMYVVEWRDNCKIILDKLETAGIQVERWSVTADESVLFELAKPYTMIDYYRSGSLILVQVTPEPEEALRYEYYELTIEDIDDVIRIIKQ
jgi:hypothetical protein